MNNFCDLVLSSIKSCLPDTKSDHPLHAPVFKGNEWLYLKECLDTTMVSSVGAYVNKFEELLSDFTGVKKVVATVNGTAALHICLKMVDIKPFDEVIIPSLTFIATANAIMYCDAIPHFADSEINTLGLDSEKLDYYLQENSTMNNKKCINLKTGRHIKAVIPMHTFGHPVNIEKLLEVCNKYNIVMIEDAAESLGSYYKGKHTGNFGKVSALSFNGNKTITTGGGGAILTNDEEIGKIAKHLTTTAKIPHKWNFYHDMVGYNYRLPNINAALGCAQMEQIDDFLKMKRNLANKYEKAFQDIKGIEFFKEPINASSNYWLNVLLLDNDNIDMKEKLLEITNSSGLMTRPVWTPMHKLPMYKSMPKMDLTCVENIESRLINIPSSVYDI